MCEEDFISRAFATIRKFGVELSIQFTLKEGGHRMWMCGACGLLSLSPLPLPLPYAVTAISMCVRL